jgi:hypothetical protein
MMLLSEMLDFAETMGQRDAAEGVRLMTSEGILEGLGLVLGQEDRIRGYHILVRNAYDSGYDNAGGTLPA